NNCTQGTFSVGTIIHGQGFDAYEGSTVKAAFAQYSGVQVLTADAPIIAGVFHFDFLFPSSTCNLGANATAGAAVFVDTNGDATCDPATDLVFAFVAYGGPGGTCATTRLMPADPRCTLSYPGDVAALTAAQTVCPAVGTC